MRSNERELPDSESYYDLIDDLDLIESSMLTQYGLRLRTIHDMPWSEFCSYLGGILPETPLGQIVSIRSEKDPKVLKKFTKEQKQIHREWRTKQANQVSKQSVEDAIEMFKNMFKSMAGGDS